MSHKVLGRSVGRCHPGSACVRSPCQRSFAKRNPHVRADPIRCTSMPASSPPAPTRSRKELKRALLAAVESQSFAEAADLKRQLDTLNAEDPLFCLQADLAKAVAEERYADAGRFKQEILVIEANVAAAARTVAAAIAAAAEAAGEAPPATGNTSSDTVTQGVRVRVKSFYDPMRSAPLERQWFFAYRVTIVNESPHVVQLISRHWIIVDGNGKRDDVRGPGVVGEQPILLPGGRFEYTSGCPLRTPSGTMEGSFTTVLLREVDGTPAEAREARVGKFDLSTHDDGEDA